MGTDVAEAVEKLPSPCDIKVHSVMCTELMKLVDRVDNIFPEIEAARPRCSSGIQSLCLLNSAIDKSKMLIRDCSESSKLYLALTGNTILSRCKKSKSLLEQSLGQIQNMVPVMLASKISQIIGELRVVKFSLDSSEEDAGKAIRSLLEGYRTGNRSEKESGNEYIRVAAHKLQITTKTSLLIERRSIKKLLTQIGEGSNKQQKKQILLFLLDLLNKYTKSIASGRVENDNIVQNQSYKPKKVDFYVDRDEDPPEEFKCPISLKLMFDPVVIDSGQTFERMWIQKWFDEGHDICPKTKRKLSNISLIPNTAMKDLILKWCETHGTAVSDPFIPFSTDANTWENSVSSVNSLSSMYSLQLPVDYSNLSLGSLDNSRQIVEESCEFDSGLFQEIDDGLPWEFQCKFVEDLMTRLSNDDRACELMSCENLVGSLVRFLKIAHDVNDVKALRVGCLLMLILVRKCRSKKYLNKDAYQLIAEFLESEVIEEALAITEELSSHQNCRSEIASSGSLTHIFKILDTQITEIQTPALKILYHLTLTRNVRSLIVSSDLIPKLVTLAENDSLSSYCIAILTNLCGTQDNKSIIAETNGCISFIASVLESESCVEQEQALEILLSLCSQSVQYCRLVMDEGVIPSVVSISINGNDNGKAKAHEMLRLLRDIEHEDHVEEFVAPIYDVSNDSNSLHVEKKTGSRASRFFSKFSRGSVAQKRKV